MTRLFPPFLLGLLALLLLAASPAPAQWSDEVSRMLDAGYDSLDTGKIDQAEKSYRDCLHRDPGNPLALNNLGVIMVKKKQYNQAQKYLKQALVKARGVKVALERVCDVDGVCAAYRLRQGTFGAEDLEGIIKTNILMLEIARSTEKTGK